MSIKKNTIANFIGQFYSILIGVIILPLYLEYLGTEAYGLVGFFTMFMSWMMLLDAGLTATLSRETARLKDTTKSLLELKYLIRSIEVIFFMISLLIILSVYNTSSFVVESWLSINALSLETVEKCIKLMGVIIIIRLFVGFYQGAVVGFEQQVWLNIYKVIFNTLKFVGAFLLIKYVTKNILFYFLYQLAIVIIEIFIIVSKVYSILPKTNLILPSLSPLKRVVPFALSIAYTSGVWIAFTQMDKLLLSHYISLMEYGYFTLVVVVSGAVMQLSAPISQAILPRMTSLLSCNKEKEMLDIYHKSTQFVSIIIFSVVAIISTFSYELLFAWTGDIEASKWASPILTWYVMGYGILAIGAFQYYLQYAYGNLKYHVRMLTIFPLITLPIIFYAVINYSALGAAIAWFWIQSIGFVIWPPFIHSKFAKGHHKEWIFKDIFPAMTATIIFVFIVNQVNIDFSIYSRLEIFLILIGLGVLMLIFSGLIYSNVRNIVLVKLSKRKNIGA